MTRIRRKSVMMISKGDLDPDFGASNQDHCNDHLVELQEKVFQNPTILEVILTHILRRKLSTPGYSGSFQLELLRLVCKTWLLEVNFIFQRHGKPLIYLDGGDLRLFLENYESRKWGTPPISLSIGSKDHLSPELCKYLNQFFRMGHLVTKLISLKITGYPFTLKPLAEEIVIDPAIGLPNFPSHFKLTNIKKISVKQLEPPRADISEHERVRIPRLEEFLRQVLNQSESLEEFKFKGNDWKECPPCQYEGLSLPGTVTWVELDSRMNLTRIIGINGGGRRILEEIKVLKLNVTTRNLFGKGEMEEILEGVRMSLEDLELNFRIVLRENNEIELRFPVMECLKRLRIGGKEWRVERSQVLNGLGDRLPRLEHLEFCNGFTDEVLMNDWCGEKSEIFGGVKSLTLRLWPAIMIDLWVGLSEEKMRRILRVFPNVEELRIENLNVRDMEGLRYMFGELGGKLRSLHLGLRGSLEREEDMERVLIGGDVEMVRRLKRRLGRGRRMAKFLGGSDGRYKSLRDLVKLEKLVVEVYAWRRLRNGWFWRMMRRPNIFYLRFGCEILFEAGFMRMPNLGRLELQGALSPGEALGEKWRRQGEMNGVKRVVEFDKVPKRKDLWLFVREWRCLWCI